MWYRPGRTPRRTVHRATYRPGLSRYPATGRRTCATHPAVVLVTGGFSTYADCGTDGFPAATWVLTRHMTVPAPRPVSSTELKVSGAPLMLWSSTATTPISVPARIVIRPAC